MTDNEIIKALECSAAESEPQMYIEYRSGKPYAYRYGDELEATILFIEGGYKTKEEAIEAWNRRANNV